MNKRDWLLILIIAITMLVGLALPVWLTGGIYPCEKGKEVVCR